MKKLIFIPLLLLVLGACSQQEDNSDITPNKRTDIILSPTSRIASLELLDFYTNFTIQGVEMNLKDVEKEDKTTILSPLSASMMLAMIANGMADDSESQKIANYLGVSDLNALNELSRTLLLTLPSLDNQSKLTLKNSLWVNNALTLSQDYSNVILKDYLAEISYNDFSKENILLSSIEGWCKKNTDGVLSSPIKNVSASDLAIFLNAMLFKSRWNDENEFDVNKTKKAIFHGYKKETETDFMVSKRYFRRYSVSDNFSCCSIDFGNESYSLTLILPDERFEPDKINHLYNNDERTSLSHSQECSVQIEIPKFKLNDNTDLSKFLKEAGIEIQSSKVWSMFQPSSTGSISMTQNTSFEIDEKGATAVSISDGEIGVTANPIDPSKEYTMVFDHPFYFFITESSTGACILSGFIADL